MPTLTLKGRLGRIAAAAAMLGLGATTLLVEAPAAHADPQQPSALVGVGSDTIQDVMNALGGYNNGTNYTPIQGGPSKQQLVSWDATPPSGTDGCLTTKLKFGSFPRPNGSSSGQRALSRAIDGTSFGPTTNTNFPCGEAAKSITGQVDFARSSAVPTSGLTGTDVLEYLPFAHDALSFGYYRAAGSPVTALSLSELQGIYTTGSLVKNGVTIIPCGIQSGSGTFNVWNTALGATATANEASSTAACNALANVHNVSGRLQESYGLGLKEKGDLAPAGVEVITGFSAGNFLAQTNGLAKNDLSGVGLGTVADWGGSAFLGTAPNLTPNPAFYVGNGNDRDLYVVVSKARLDGFGDLGMKGLFVDTDATSVNNAAICSSAAQTTVNLFGFTSLGDAVCGQRGLTTGSRTGTF
jgi:ABC-type phosphate transport system substrate-binding protein